ncbi:transposase [Arenibacter sp. GZD96]|uniref:transposase n=1 Tax=Aurantibrevibacter litoralis TaxID=3106030 RepID=UPI002AFE00E0|nr:transposase [Arenibacter sp. GZD-96]MEA1785190.1 transposase [Arenibacter sp. GZD-96]
MPHSFIKIWIHAIWATTERTADHVHGLFLLRPQKSIANVVTQIKGSSSHYINQNNRILEKFAWQTGYADFSVSESVVEKVRKLGCHSKIPVRSLNQYKQS